nr:cation transporter [Chroococcidiopsis sp. CCNUC1]
MESQPLTCSRCRAFILRSARFGIDAASRLAGTTSCCRQATFGYQRLEILVALLNGLGLMAIAAWIAWQAIGRFQTPLAYRCRS